MHIKKTGFIILLLNTCLLLYQVISIWWITSWKPNMTSSVLWKLKWRCPARAANTSTTTALPLFSTKSIPHLTAHLSVMWKGPPRNLKPCVLEKLDPWDNSLSKYLNPQSTPLQCSDQQPMIYVDKNGILNFNEAVLKLYKMNMTNLKCTSRAVNRRHDDTNVDFGPELVVTLPIFVKSHFFRVTCMALNGIVIYDYLHFNPFWNSEAKYFDNIENESPSKPSLIMFGFDSVSRPHAFRNLPKSYEYLLEEFHAYDFEGYNRVGENTWPNIVPLLSGKSHRDFPNITNGEKHCDKMPLIWYEKVMKHVVTMYAEDAPMISSFNVNTMGFEHQPTDYYVRPYTLAMRLFNVTTSVSSANQSEYHCYGGVSEFEIQIDYLKGFLSRYHGKRKFAFFYNTKLSHDDFNTLKQGDEPFLHFLRWMKFTGQTENAIFVTLSDHGFRNGDAAGTRVGRKEQNRPWLMLHVPKRIRQKNTWLHKTLIENSKKLVTAYQTMLDLINGKAIEQQQAFGVQNHLVRRNLFYPIPTLRSCLDAGIEQLFCGCQERVYISPGTILVKTMDEFLVNGINHMLSVEKNLCRTLSLNGVVEAKVIYSESDVKQSIKRHNETIPRPGLYFIVFYTIPGHGHFEGTVDVTQDSVNRSYPHMTMVGEPLRLNRFGDQSFCMNQSLLKPYCYCKEYMHF